MSSDGTGCLAGACLANWNADALVIFSVALLFVLVNMAGMVWLKRPEAWLIALIASMMLAYIPLRLVLGGRI